MAKPQKHNEDNSQVKPSADGAAPAPETVKPEAPNATQPEVREVIVEKIVERIVERPVYVQAPTPPPPGLPRQMSVERFGDVQSPLTIRWPQIRGGICEFCGVIDGNTPSQYQYKLCNHYRGMQVRCSYCPAQKDPDDVVYHSNVNVYEDPDKRGVIIFQCDSSECVNKHYRRFQRADA